MIAELLPSIEWLAGSQYRSDGPDYFRGEFPMYLTGPVSRRDHNFLSGYTLLHCALAARLPGIPDAARRGLLDILKTARDLPWRYQSDAGTANWYSGRGAGFRGPADYPWQAERLHLRDDYDDTAVAVLLANLGGLRLRHAIAPEQFAEAAYDPRRHVLVPKSQRRLALAGVAEGVYQSWALAGKVPPQVKAVPEQNSTELTTVANAVTAVARLGGITPAQHASRAFVNGMVRVSVQKLIEGDASYLDFASSYYPRVPFAPLAFVVHDHWLMNGGLLDPDCASLVARAVRDVSPVAAWRRFSYANPAYWLNCALWCVQAGLLAVSEIDRKAKDVWSHVRAHAARSGSWPDIEFFHAAHLGNYSGEPYAAALLIETMALLCACGLD
jgi:hypothetical protein